MIDEEYLRDLINQTDAEIEAREFEMQRLAREITDLCERRREWFGPTRMAALAFWRASRGLWPQS